jgi:hypothetical protein
MEISGRTHLTIDRQRYLPIIVRYLSSGDFKRVQLDFDSESLKNFIADLQKVQEKFEHST